MAICRDRTHQIPYIDLQDLALSFQNETDERPAIFLGLNELQRDIQAAPLFG